MLRYFIAFEVHAQFCKKSIQVAFGHPIDFQSALCQETRYLLLIRYALPVRDVNLLGKSRQLSFLRVLGLNIQNDLRFSTSVVINFQTDFVLDRCFL
jgi:hypothetical protein